MTRNLIFTKTINVMKQQNSLCYLFMNIVFRLKSYLSFTESICLNLSIIFSFLEQVYTWGKFHICSTFQFWGVMEKFILLADLRSTSRSAFRCKPFSQRSSITNVRVGWGGGMRSWIHAPFNLLSTLRSAFSPKLFSKRSSIIKVREVRVESVLQFGLGSTSLSSNLSFAPTSVLFRLLNLVFL